MLRWVLVVVGALAVTAGDGEISSVPGTGLQIDFDGSVVLTANVFQTLLTEVELLREELNEIKATRRQEGLWPGSFTGTSTFYPAASPRSNAFFDPQTSDLTYYIHGGYDGIHMDKEQYSMFQPVQDPQPAHNFTADYRPWSAIVNGTAGIFALSLTENAGELDTVKISSFGFEGPVLHIDLAPGPGETFPSADVYTDGGDMFLVYTASHASASRVGRATASFGAFNISFTPDVAAVDVIGSTSSVARCGEFICVVSTEALRNVYLSVYDHATLTLQGRTLVYSVGADDAGLKGRVGATHLDGAGDAFVVDISNGPLTVLVWSGSGNNFARVFESKPPFRGSRSTPRFFVRDVGHLITYLFQGFNDGVDGESITQSVWAWDVDTQTFVIIKGTTSPGPAFDVVLVRTHVLEIFWAIGNRGSTSATFVPFGRYLSL